jgi:hypothetical protein
METREPWSPVLPLGSAIEVGRSTHLGKNPLLDWFRFWVAAFGARICYSSRFWGSHFRLREPWSCYSLVLQSMTRP